VSDHQNYATGQSLIPPKPWAVQCCGCSGLMTVDGGTIELGGVISPEARQMAVFATHAEADEAAAAAGWQVKDSSGPNHRCKKCIRDRSRQRRGAYVHVSQLV
jgi:hypothetical protein